MRFKFVGKYGELKYLGFYYQSFNGAQYIYKTPESGCMFLMITKSGGMIHCEQNTEYVLDKLLPFLSKLSKFRSDVPEKLYYNKVTDKLHTEVDKNNIHYQYTRAFEGSLEYYKKTGLRPQHIYNIYNQNKLWDVLLDMYNKGMLELVDDFSYDTYNLYD